MNTNLRSAGAHIKRYLKKEYSFLKTSVRSYELKNNVHKRFEEISVDIEDHHKLDPIALSEIRSTLDQYQMGTYYPDKGIYELYTDTDGQPLLTDTPAVHRVRLFLRDEVES